MIKNIIYITVAIIFVLAYFRYFEHRSLYFPMKDIEITPRAVGMDYEDVYFQTIDDVRLNAWLIPAKDSRYTILFCHGNGGNISHRIEKILLLNGLGVDVFIFDYRGYGKSRSRPSERGLYKDVASAYNYLVFEKKISPDQIILYGESLGGAVAIELASNSRVKALITECTFSSAKDMAQLFYPFLPSFLIASKFDAIGKIKDIAIPKLIIHSQNDEIVPFRQSVALFEASRQPKTHLILMGSHNTCFLDSEDLYVEGIRDFLNKL